MNKVIIIAEAGVNHNGSLDIAKKLIDEAANAGVDYVKFQTFKAENLISEDAPKAAYQIENTKNTSETQFQMLKNLELSVDDHHTLIKYCEQKNIKFFSTAFDLESLDFLNTLGFTLFKIPSGEITNYPYLKKIASFGKAVILSTGMCTMQEIHAAVDVLVKHGIAKEQISILHCNTDYPTAMQDVNLKAMLAIKNEFNTAVGYSDHTLGIEVPVAAVALGATIIEKHFTLDKNLPGPDHAASLEPIELKAMVDAIRNVEQAISGSGKKIPSESELKNIGIARKSIVARVSIKKGEIFTENNLTTKRPSNGISAMQWEEVVGKTASHDFEQGQLISVL
jgi:N,N'-diacetyllegionaminate synthase